MHQIAEAAWKCADPGMHYDTTMNDWHTCPATGRINACNPCSEYLHVDNSACNLASLNLMKFRDPETDEFQVERFERAVDVIFMAQEILVGNSSYPTEEITAERPRDAPARPRLRQPGRAADGARPGLRLRRGPRLRGRDLGDHDRARLPQVGRHGRPHGRRSTSTPQNSDAMLRVIRKHRAAVGNIDAGAGAGRHAARPPGRRGTTRSRWARSTATATPRPS